MTSLCQRIHGRHDAGFQRDRGSRHCSTYTGDIYTEVVRNEYYDKGALNQSRFTDARTSGSDNKEISVCSGAVSIPYCGSDTSAAPILRSFCWYGEIEGNKLQLLFRDAKGMFYDRKPALKSQIRSIGRGI